MFTIQNKTTRLKPWTFTKSTMKTHIGWCRADVCIRESLQISLQILSEFRWINFYFPYAFLMISGGTEVNQFVWIRLISEVKFGDKQFKFEHIQQINGLLFLNLTQICILTS